MPAPYKTMFRIGQKLVTSLIVDQEEFDEIVESMRGVSTSNEQRLDDEGVKSLKKQKLAVLGLGTLTKPIFDKYGVETDLLSVAVRGLTERMMGQFNPENN